MLEKQEIYFLQLSIRMKISHADTQLNKLQKSKSDFCTLLLNTWEQKDPSRLKIEIDSSKKTKLNRNKFCVVILGEPTSLNWKDIIRHWWWIECTNANR